MSEMNLDNARGWRPDVGDVLIGKVLDISKGWSEQGEKYYPIVTVDPEGPVRVSKLNEHGNPIDGEFETITEPVAVHCFHTVLYARMVEVKPRQGERIGIKYVRATEKVRGKKGNTPSIYNVRVEGRTSEVWDVMDQDERAVAARARNRALENNSVPVTTEDFSSSDSTDDDDIPF